MKKSSKHLSLIKYSLCAILLLCCGIFSWYFFKPTPQCDFFRAGQCLICAFDQAFPVGYKENCEKCSDRTAYYIEGGIIPAWLCAPQNTEISEDVIIERNNTRCPKSRLLKDLVGNCYSCDTEEIVRLLPSISKNLPCQNERYLLPDSLTLKSLKCPLLENINDPEVCVSCNGIWNGDFCTHLGENTFCHDNNDCPKDQWCFPFKINHKLDGVCTNLSKTKWFCSKTDGYDLETTELLCARQGMHIPTLEEIEQADEDLNLLCPTLDMWTFFSPDGVVWLESFVQEFLFTREGESEKLGGHTFYALCHKD